MQEAISGRRGTARGRSGPRALTVRLLSYPLGPETPPAGDDLPVVVEAVASISEGAPCNIQRLTLSNHIGTHFDAPWHFNPDGLRVTDLGLSWFSYARPCLLDVPKNDGELIGFDDLERQAGAIGDADAIFIRTGFAAATRSREPRRYSTQAPGFAADAAAFFMALPALRAVGLDSISATAPMHQDEGIGFHRRMLGSTASDRFILLIEDMLLADDLTSEDLAEGVFMAPLLLDGLDGAPVTVVAW
jgi:kynurenine formamidase